MRHRGYTQQGDGRSVDGFWQRLKQRKLVQWALAYIAAAFAVIQVLDVVAQRFGWPGLIEKLIILAFAVGFLVMLVLAWYHGERGMQRVGGAELLIIALLLAIGGGALWVFARAPSVSGTVAAAPQTIATQQPRAAARSSGPRIATPVSASRIPEKSVAVLPFVNESGDKDQQYFSDGLSEDLINALSQFAGLKVIGRNSSFQFRASKDSSKAIGQKLGVAHILEGSVQRQGVEVRITVTLVNAADGSTLWSQHYDRPYKDVFALQDAITKAVSGALQARLLVSHAAAQSERPPSGNLEAWQAYQRGKFYDARWTEAAWDKALGYYATAIRLDPHYAAAYAWASIAWTDLAALYVAGAAQRQAYARARAAADKAVVLAPDLALAYMARGYVVMDADLDWKGALAAVRRAAQLAPTNAEVLSALSFTDAALGRVRVAVDLTRKTLAADPLHANLYRWLSGYLAGLGRLDEAQQAIDRAIELQPAANFLHGQLAVVAVLRGDAKAALAAVRQESHPDERRFALALATQLGPDRKAADAALQTLIVRDSDGWPYEIAEVYALRHDPDAMFQWLDRAWVARQADMAHLLSDPFILRYRDDPRFAAFCKKVGLPTTTDAVAMK